MTIGFHSPMPPARTGVADYSEALVRALRKHAEVRVNPGGGPVDAAIYQIGNNPLHREAYRRALAEPGAVVLHDAVLQHFHLGLDGEDAYVSEFVYNYGEWNRGLARDLWRGRARSGLDEIYFRYPMLRRIAERSRAVVVHNPAAARLVREHCESARVEEVPHLFEAPPPVDPVTVIERRARWGRFVFGLFGHLRESKRVMTVLAAFGDLRRIVPDASLLVAGDFVSEDLARAAAPLLDAPGVIRVPYVPEHDFWVYAHAADACVNLRYPSAGETSGIAIRLMGIGKPVLVTAGEETSRFPETACLRVDPGAAEREMLLATMLLLAEGGDVARRIGREAAAFVREKHDPDAVARRMIEVACRDHTPQIRHIASTPRSTPA